MEALLLLLLLRVTVTFSLLSLSSSAFTPDTAYFLDCGSSSAVAASGDSPPRNFTPDSAFLTSASDSTSLSSPNPSTAIYATARAFTAKASYSFKISNPPATHFLRLHFLPFSTPNGTLNLTAARFDVSALNHFLLLANFSPAAAAAADPSTPIIKEYLIPVDADELVLTFDPRNSSLAFVNAIELFTAPSNLLSSQPKTVGSAQSVGQLDLNALQTVYRVNVGGPTVTPANDTLWRYWTPDDHYMFSSKSLSFENSTTAAIKYNAANGWTAEIAPEIVYSTARTVAVTSLANPNFKFNLTWSFPVSSGYTYLVRLHFCNFISSDLFFDVYLGSDLVFKDLHTGDFTDYDLNAAFYQDFAAVPGGSGFINISLSRSAIIDQSFADNAILNGVEIMKINNSVANLDGGGFYNPNFDGGNRKGSFHVLIGSVVGGSLAIGGGLSIAVAIFVTRHRRLRRKQKTRSSLRSWSTYPNTSHSRRSRRESASGASASLKEDLCLHISFADIKSATNGFADDHVIGSGGFGKVYKGVLRDGTPVAVKRGMPGSKQGYPEFQMEILILSRIRHRHLVSLIGYCDERSEMLLVYELMEKGPLKHYLYGRPELPCLSWKQRLEICIAAARGLHFLHTGYSHKGHSIIHRDVKSSNILLGKDYLAKVSDFGISRPGPGFDESYVSTAVKGSFGYFDPEYFKTQKLTDKSDVYSFGVMLFEVLCARPVIDQSLPREQLNLTEWALYWQRKGSLDRIVDPRISGKINDKSLKEFGKTAEKCLAEYGNDRPSIGDVLWNLEYALQLQETELTRDPYEDSGNVDAAEVCVLAVRRVLSTSTVVDEADDESLVQARAKSFPSW